MTSGKIVESARVRKQGKDMTAHRPLVLCALMFVGSPLSYSWAQGMAQKIEMTKDGPQPFDGDIGSLAAKSPEAIVNVRAQFKHGVTAEEIARLVTQDNIHALSMFIYRPHSAQSYYSIGYSFSASEPNMPDQLARARCQEQFPAVVNMKPDELTAFGSVMLSAAQAYRWSMSPPPIITQVTVTARMNDRQIARAKEIMHNVLTTQLPTASEKPLSTECKRYLRQR